MSDETKDLDKDLGDALAEPSDAGPTSAESDPAPSAGPSESSDTGSDARSSSSTTEPPAVDSSTTSTEAGSADAPEPAAPEVAPEVTKSPERGSEQGEAGAEGPVEGDVDTGAASEPSSAQELDGVEVQHERETPKVTDAGSDDGKPSDDVPSETVAGADDAVADRDAGLPAGAAEPGDEPGGDDGAAVPGPVDGDQLPAGDGLEAEPALSPEAPEAGSEAPSEPQFPSFCGVRDEVAEVDELPREAVGALRDGGIALFKFLARLENADDGLEGEAKARIQAVKTAAVQLLAAVERVFVRQG